MDPTRGRRDPTSSRSPRPSLRGSSRSRCVSPSDAPMPRRCFVRSLAVAIAVAAAGLAVAAQDGPLDLVIRQARVLDGTGNPWMRADVGVRAGRIVAIGDLSARPAARTIDAKNRILAPGFIDI